MQVNALTSANTQLTPNNTQFNKDTFLQILVAQMKYQNPMEPESNTEFITQFATFSQLEQLNNIQNELTSLRADLSVGKIAKVDDGKESITGKIDSVSYLDGVPYVSICGNNYLFDKIRGFYKDLE